MAALYKSLLPIILQISLCFSSKLNAPKVLLPYYSTVATNFTLEASDGCFTWRSTRPEVATVQIIPLHHGKECSNKAVVTAVSTQPNKLTSIILAEEQETGQMLRCDVIVDRIHSITVETTTRELYLEDSPESFEIKALDDELNTFSSLQGEEFDWTLVNDPESDVPATTILRILRFADTSYAAPPDVLTLESAGKQGNVALVEGIKTGSAKVNIRLKDPIYKDVSPAEVQLVVIDNLLLNPSYDVYLVQGQRIKYRVERFRQGKINEVAMPSPQYRFELQGSNIASLDRDTSTVTALAMGTTTITLYDKNIKLQEAPHHPTAGIHVVEPGSLKFVIAPGKSNVLETGREYEVTIEVYSKNPHKIYPSENLLIEGHFPAEFFEVLHSSQNGSYHVVRTVQKGFPDIKGSMRGIVKSNGEPDLLPTPVEGSQSVEIYDPILVIPPITVFPWEPSTRLTYQKTLKAVGGSGAFTWSSSAAAIATVNSKGLVTTATVGSTVITAADVKNTAHTGQAKVYVLPPSEIQFLPSPVEAEIGTTLDLPLALFADLAQKPRVLHHYEDCRQLKMDFKFSDKAVFQLVEGATAVESPVNTSCRAVQVKALTQGHTLLTATYRHASVSLQATVTIAAYNPLKPVDPEQTAVVAIGSSKDVVFQGGPLPWVLDTSKYHPRALAEKDALVSIDHVPSYGGQKNLHIFRVLCKDIGDQTLTSTVENGPTSKNQFPASARGTVHFSCAVPTSLQLYPVLRYPQSDPPCPITPESGQQIPVHNYENLDVDVVVTDGNGRHFDNFSSLAIAWETSDQSLADFASPTTTIREVHGQGKYTGHKVLTSMQTVVPKRKRGSMTITGTIKGYNQRFFQYHGIKIATDLSPRISSSLDLLLVDDVKLAPDSVSIFNHPSNKVQIVVSGGSGHFHVEPSDGKISQVFYNDKTRSIEVVPVDNGALTLTVHDLCLEMPRPARAVIHISGVEVIEVKMVDKVQLYNVIRADVRVLDSSGEPLAASVFPLMNLTPHPATDIISVRPDPQVSADPYTVRYEVRGDTLGHTTLSFQASAKSGETISSLPMNVQVFPPLKLSPRNITLIIGEVFQVVAIGGPQPLADIVYSIGNRDIATIDRSGLIEAVAVGDTVVTGVAQTEDPESRATVTCSQDQVLVYVVRLTGVKIHTPLNRIQTGEKMPLYVMGVNEHQTPFTFGHSVPGLTFHWSLGNKDVVDLQPVYKENGVTLSEDDAYAMRVRALNQGQTNIGLRVKWSPRSYDQVEAGATLTDTAHLHVFEKLRLVHPETDGSLLLMSPKSVGQIRTNRDGACKVVYELLTCPEEGSVVAVDSQGRVTAGTVTGQANVRVTALEESGLKQTIIVLVKVKPVSYITVNSETDVASYGNKLSVIPVGMTMTLRVNFHDNVGEEFHATSAVLKKRPNRFDLTQISRGPENGTFVLKAAHVGHTILKVWDEANPRIADFVPVPVGYAISPAQATVSRGDVICLSTQLELKEGSLAKWETSDRRVVQVVSTTGLALAANPGTTTVHYRLSATQSTHTEVTVVPVEEVQILTNGVKFVTNVPQQEPYLVPVVLGTGNTNLQGNCTKDLLASMTDQQAFLQKSLFHCGLLFSSELTEVSAREMFLATPGFDPESGRYFCRVSQVQQNTHQIQAMSTVETSLQLQVFVQPSDGQTEVSSPIASLRFYPAFHLSKTDLVLSNKQPQGEVTVSGVLDVLNNIQVVPSDGSLLHVGSPRVADSTYTRVVYPISLQDTQSPWKRDLIDTSLTLTCSLTGQVVKVPVSLVAEAVEQVQTLLNNYGLNP
ncbi:PREDICTED: nuclear pore membrane glycoprotein 210-like [Branchiostoma belcheri]|uniref:Nuclear pore membrane glycoprotein 210-like n=1 Tax=Branchiostoma belcheri TaxID=7741 RepID=A0A6P4Z9B0_BRABE|nr:PREDICTED: nuclear pore membrane glycoprotein 210-like [Branchiostoma belcheri]